MQSPSENSDLTGQCPCGSGQLYAACCGPFHAGSCSASTAEQLMRSRYSAYALQNETYLLETWDPSTRPFKIDFPVDLTWVDLEILHCKKGGVGDKKGIVEFRARYSAQGKTWIMQEISRFHKQDARWWYRNGTVKSPIQVGD